MFKETLVTVNQNVPNGEEEYDILRQARRIRRVILGM